MNVLFVYSGNFSRFPISPFTRAQAESLQDRGLAVEFFPVKGKGVMNYLKNVAPLRKRLRERPVDVIHAHYALCGWVAVLAAGRTPVVVSLMGDDAQGTFSGRQRITLKSRLLILLTLLLQPFVQAIIYKSAQLGKVVFRKKIGHLIPNGVRLEQFVVREGGYRAELGLDPGKQYVLFLGNPEDVNKNMALAAEAVRRIGRSDLEMLPVFGIDHDTVVHYLNSVDAFVLCSFGEGSPNVVKEAMACNCPMVVTPAGDAAWVVGDTEGCAVAGYDPADFAEKLQDVLAFARTRGRTRGRERIVALGLDAATVAERLEGIYREVVKRRLRG